MSSFEGGRSWSELSEEEKRRAVENAKNRILSNTGYPSKEEKRAAKKAAKARGFAANDKRQPGNRPKSYTPKTSI